MRAVWKGPGHPLQTQEEIEKAAPLMRAVEDPSAHPLPWELWRKGSGKKGSLGIPCARATRGRRLPSLDARTLENRRAELPPIP